MQSDKFIKHLEDGSILLTAPVMIPYTLDCDGPNGEPPLNPTQILAFKNSYDKYGFVDHEHGLTKDGRKIGEPSQSIILDHDTTFTTIDGTNQVYPSGTWLLTTHITDDEAISEANKGYYTGYSPSILPRESADKYLAALKAGKEDECACKNQISSMGNSLIKDVPDPVVLSVSLTRQPCLHESKFCELDNMEEDISLKSKILTAMGMSEEAEVVALKSEVSELKSEIEGMKTTFEEALKSMQEEFKQTLTEALTPVEEGAVEVAVKKLRLNLLTMLLKKWKLKLKKKKQKQRKLSKKKPKKKKRLRKSQRKQRKENPKQNQYTTTSLKKQKLLTFIRLWAEMPMEQEDTK